MQVYQAIVLFICFAIFAGTFVLAKLYPLPAHRTKRMVVHGSLAPLRARTVIWYTAIAWGILGLEVFKRVYTSGWSVTAAIINSLAPRGMTPWGSGGSNLGGDNFIFQIVAIVLPFSGLLLAFLLSRQRGLVRFVNGFAYLAVLLLLVSNGSRTPVVATLLGLVLFMIYRPISTMRKVMIVTAVATITALILSAMVLFRSEGYLNAFEKDESYEVKYHQDNNYFRAVRALEIASTSSERWDPFTFWATTAVNPIPRTFWPGKPALLQDFWGNYKTEWQTISFVGELAAMFGPVAGSFLAVLTGWLVFVFMRVATRTLRWPGGLIVYMILILYGYMVFRSLMNVVLYLYLPAFAFTAYWLTHQRGGGDV
jgi:oligosaccharide repeat unit polymerase